MPHPPPPSNGGSPAKRIDPKPLLTKAPPPSAVDCAEGTCRERPTAPGIGKVLALTILLETGDIGRFPGPGHYASYCRCVGSARIGNGKSKGKGKGNTKIG